MVSTQLSGSPAGQVLMILQRRGTATIKELEDALGVTATAVRQQLVGLMADGYVRDERETERAGRGRPRHFYSLTAAGRALFPHYYDEFTNSLLREILVSDGSAKVQALLGRMGQRLAEEYTLRMAGQAPAERAKELTELLNAKGILAEMQLVPDAILVREFTCPYYELAREHRAICDMEQDMMSHVIRQRVELVTCTLDGHHGCQFRIEA
jgi:DeoR family suf operon transcriptional repressor